MDRRQSLSDPQLSPRDKAEDAVRLGFEHIGNLYMKPSWWRSLPEPAQNTAIARMPSGGSGVPRQSGCLKPDGLCYTPNIEAAETLAN
jgi:hypothetical protein